MGMVSLFILLDRFSSLENRYAFGDLGRSPCGVYLDELGERMIDNLGEHVVRRSLVIKKLDGNLVNRRFLGSLAATCWADD